MGVRRWMFFHPNDGTRPYPDNDLERNQPLWERIQDLDNVIERQGAHINELSDRLQQYQGRVLGTSELVQSQTMFNLRDVPNGDVDFWREQMIDGQLINLIREIHRRNLIEIVYTREDNNYDNTIIRTRLRVVPPNN